MDYIKKLIVSKLNLKPLLNSRANVMNIFDFTRPY